MNLDKTLSIPNKIILLSFVISAFQALENGLVRKECAPLVSISVWHNLQSGEILEQTIEKNPLLRKSWRAATKRFDAADETVKARYRFERSWLYSMLLDFFGRLHSDSQASHNILYCERFLEFLADLDSQLPTRRYVNTLLKDLNTLVVIRTSNAFNEEGNALLRDMFYLLRHFVTFGVDEHSGSSLSSQELYDQHCEALGRLQRTAIKHFKEKLTLLALSNYGSIEQRHELEGHLASLTDDELTGLCTFLGFRTTYPSQAQTSVDRNFLLEIVLSAFEARPSFAEAAAELETLPTEDSLYDSALLKNERYDGSRPLAIPRLNLQYLSIGDFLWRSFLLHRSEAFFEIRKDMETIAKRLQPRASRDGKSTTFHGFSKMAIPISRPAIIEVVPPKVGSTIPATVRAEVALDVGSLNPSIRKEWEELRTGDVIFLLSLQASANPQMSGADHVEETGSAVVRVVRAAEIMQILDEKGRPLRDLSGENGHALSRPRLRRLLINLDSRAYSKDQKAASAGSPDVYDSINIIARRQGRENNFKSVLDTMQKLIVADTRLPSWFQEVFLGYGDPARTNDLMSATEVKEVDFRDTFLDWQHLIESFPGKTIEPQREADSSFGPPYVLEIPKVHGLENAPKPSKKRRREQPDPARPLNTAVRVSTYKPKNTGPYPSDAPKTNEIRYTPMQVEAISSGVQPGLTLIVGPPGTGKTDVVSQIINILYHNFPQERILLVTHGNQALNQLFQKLMGLDIDAQHLLRLGHGEGDLDTDASYSKHGRVETFLENRYSYLAEVSRLAGSIQAQGAHGGSCETAGYFNTVYIQPAWSKFWDQVRRGSISNDDFILLFPFHEYFATAPQPIFDPSAPRTVLIDIAEGCQRHIQHLFSELEKIRPFEILRSAKDRANYMLVKEARIVAMTSTHAAMRRNEIASLGFHYDTVIMEEAAQITEAEGFIPCLMQNSKQAELPLKRVVLCGDHLQNSPIVQNLAFRQYANLEQSLFLRLVRLGVPAINLDAQGRARASLAKLFKWRYKQLENLPIVEEGAEFQRANAGFQFDYQFIDVPDYQGCGEREPTPHFIQNLGEAEYAVAIYQYMRLLGYPAHKISILATYAGQRALIKDVLDHRCKGNPLFGLPKAVSTVDRYQGEQNDCKKQPPSCTYIMLIETVIDVILSLTRTKSAGYLRDVRRLTVALSRARLGLYILGRRGIFANCAELRPAFELLAQRPDKLMLVGGELYPAQRSVGSQAAGVPMEGIEHLGNYVYEMTQAKIKSEGVVVDDVIGNSALDEVADGADHYEDGQEEEEE